MQGSPDLRHESYVKSCLYCVELRTLLPAMPQGVIVVAVAVIEVVVVVVVVVVDDDEEEEDEEEEEEEDACAPRTLFFEACSQRACHSTKTAQGKYHS